MEISIDIVLWVAVVYLAIALMAYALQGYFIFHPEKLPRDFNFRYSFQAPFKEVFIQTSCGEINALHFTVRDPKGVVLYFKGNTRSIKGWGKFSKDFLREGYDFFIFDYPGFGKSSGDRCEANFYEVSQKCYEYLSEKYSQDAIVIYGRSLGCGFAAQCASVNKVKLVILDAPFYNFVKLAAHFAVFLPLKSILRYSFSVREHLEKVDERVFILHGKKDRVIPFRFSKMLEEELPETIRLIPIENGRHNNLPSLPKYHTALHYILTGHDHFHGFDDEGLPIFRV